MISNLLIISDTDVVPLRNDGRGYCLIVAFFQGLYLDDGRIPLEKQQLILDAMKLVLDNEELAREKLSEDSQKVIGTWYHCLTDVAKDNALKAGSFWNYEILEFYIDISKLKVQLYYFKEFVTNKYVLLKTRNSMERQEGLKVVSVIELLSHHKILIKHFINETSVEDLLDNTNFSSLIDVTDACAPYGENTFIPLDICKKANVANDSTSGYASIAKSIGKSTVYIIEQLAEHYLSEFDESTNSELFTKGQELRDWIKSNQNNSLPEKLSLTLDDGMSISL